MSQQLQITGGAKVRNLEGVLTGTSGVVNALAINVPNGIPQLDGSGKILVSQLPNSVMEYKGTWDASTNTPTLVNGTGNQGDVYLCNVAGTTNFGAGPITFAVGDSAIYSGTIWQRAGGATGTVTSVGLTSTGNDAITITGSPITTSGNINLGFAGTNLQYINGAGDLTTFPTLISSIGLTMPSAFSVANSPLTSNGTIAVTGAGYPSQYIRGDGTLADFPTSGGGGSSVSYYLNGGTSQGTIGGVTYYEMSKTADTGTGVDFTKSGDGFIVAFLTDAGDPAQLNIPAGNWNYEIYASMSANGGTPEMYAELYKYDGTTFTLISTSSNEILYDGTNLNLYTFAMTVPSTTLAITDRLAIKLYATNSGGKTTTVHTQDSHLCQVITTFSTGITALNGLTAQVQYFATGTSGTDFNISSSTATHTFNIPSASATNRGLITTGSQTIAGNKTFTGENYFSLVNMFDQSVNYKTGGVLVGVSGYISQGYDKTGTGAGSTLSMKIADGNSVKNISLDFVGSPVSTPYTYTFPAASGTLALLESTQTFTGVNTFTGTSLILAPSAGDGGILNLKRGAYTGGINDYTSITSQGDDLSLVSLTSSTNRSIKFDFSSITSGILRTYTLPNASGTISLLESTQTFSGVNTFSALTSFTFSSGTRMDYGPYLTKGSVPTVFSGSTTNIYSDATTNNIVIRDNSSSAKLLFDNSTQTFTFPAATGTIALTSNLSSYLPLAGGIMTGSILLNNNLTISGQLFGTSSYASMLAMSPSDKVLIDNSGRGVIFGGTIGQGAYIYNFPSASGTIALTSNLSSYVPYTGATTNVDLGNNYLISTNVVSTSMIITTGTNNVGGVKMANLTTITLGGSGGDNTRILPSSSERSIFFDQGYISGGSTFNKVFKFDLSSLTNATTRTYTLPDASGTIALTSNITSAISGTTNYHAKFTGTNTIGNSLIWDNGTNVGIGNTNTSYTLDVSGTGRFTDKITSTFGSNGTMIENTSSTTNYLNIIRTTSTGSNLTMWIENSTGGNRAVGSLAYAGGLCTYTSTALQFGTDNNIRMTITSAGNVGIGTSSPAAKLSVSTSFGNVNTNTYILLSNPAGGGGGRIRATNVFGDLAAIEFSDEGGGDDGNLRFFTALNASLSERMRITSGGTIFMYNLGGYSSSNADVRFDTSSKELYYQTSSLRYKINIVDLEDSLQKITYLRPVRYQDKNMLTHSCGLIAEEVAKIIPDVVFKKEIEGFDEPQIEGVNYSDFVPFIIKAIQEMNTKLDEQNQTIQNLQEQINILAK